MKAMTPAERQQLLDCGFDAPKLVLLTRYGELLGQWQKAINLVSPKTLPDIWSRHILDSAQLWPHLQNLSDGRTEFSCLDLGSGGGLPGIILAIAGIPHITLVESDTRKCIFLKEVIRELRLGNCTVVNARIENVPRMTVDFIAARALAPLKQLLSWGNAHLNNDGHFIFLKGADVSNEIKELSELQQNSIELRPSITASDSQIVIISKYVSHET